MQLPRLPGDEDLRAVCDNPAGPMFAHVCGWCAHATSPSSAAPPGGYSSGYLHPSHLGTAHFMHHDDDEPYFWER